MWSGTVSMPPAAARKSSQHLEPRDKVVQKLVSLLKPGGHIVISEVNAWNLPLQLQLLRARGLNMFVTYVDEQGTETLMGNERILSAWGLERLFRR